jgi:hypothetical protein
MVQPVADVLGQQGRNEAAQTVDQRIFLKKFAGQSNGAGKIGVKIRKGVPGDDPPGAPADAVVGNGG